MAKTIVYFCFFYFIFVVYGSLVPLDYKPLPYEQALIQFKNIQFIDLGIESRADWIANILLYIPLSFSLLGCCSGLLRRSLAARTFLTVIIWLLCLSIAVGVEFVQQFFPPRTVSINDLIAEAIGSSIGVVFWHISGERAIDYCRQIAHGNWLSIKASIIIFLPVYIFLSLFPFDFVTSIAELEEKLSTGQDSLFVDSNACNENVFRCIIKNLVEILILVPLGGAFAALPYVRNRNSLAIVVGFVLGVFVEVCQIFIYSGSAQGLSILNRMLGMAIGVKLYALFLKCNHEAIRLYLVRVVYWVVPLYLLIAMAVNGWMDGGWISISAAQQKLTETKFLPFYYYYFTSETIALVSLLSNVGTYLPVGVLYWLYEFRKDEKYGEQWKLVGVIALVVAIVIEGGKLFLSAKHVDPTDVLIAFFSASCAYIGLSYFRRLVNQSGQVPSQWSVAHSAISIKYPSNKIGTTSRLVIDRRWIVPVFVCFYFLVYKILKYPIFPGFLVVLFSGYCYLLYRNQNLGVFILPALLPLMDISPYSGRFFFDEYDLMVLLTLAVVCLCRSSESFVKADHRVLGFVLLGWFSLCLIISLFLGITPFAAVDANAFSNYYSNYNALRVAKGFFWAGALGFYLIRAVNTIEGRKLFSLGIGCGLLGVSAFVVTERWVFSGIFDFSLDYRVNGLFSSMHTGGGHIESFLALTMPFIALLFVDEKYPVASKFAGMLLFALSLYALLMSFSRGGLVGFIVEFIVILIGLAIHFKSKGRFRVLQSTGLLLLLSTIMGLFAVPVFYGELMRHRIDVAGQDSESRHQHWKAAFDMMDTGLITQLFGMGLGSFPRTFYWLNQDNSHPATYRIESENGNQYLLLRGGDSLFMGQYVAINPHQHLKLVMDVRSPDADSMLTVPICEKSLQYSFRCVSSGIKVTSSLWQHVERDIDTGDVGGKSYEIAGGWLSRPVQLALYAGVDAEKIVEIDNLSLFDENGRNLISNGDFSAGTDRWYFSTEKHNPWHIFNIWVQVLFDMGWLGLLSFVCLIGYLYYHLYKSLKQDVYSPILLSSFTGFLVIGYVDSPFDAPRLTFLFFMLVIFAIFGCKRSGRHFRTS